MDDWKRVGRNEPCPCKSGKKYKHCHMQLDKQAAEEAKLATKPEARKTELDAALMPLEDMSPEIPPASISTPKPEIDPEEMHLISIFNTFTEASYEEKIAICRDAILSGDLDTEMVFEFFLDLFDTTAENDERTRLDELANLLAQHQPHLYEDQAAHLLEMQVSNALFTGRLDEIDTLIERWGREAGRKNEQYVRILSMLSYYGLTNTLPRARELGWEGLKKNDVGYFDWVFAEFISGHIDEMIVIQYLADPHNTDLSPELLKVIERYSSVEDMEIDLNVVEQNLHALTDPRDHPWHADDFDFQSSNKEPDPAIDNLNNLLFQFIAYAHHQEGIPITRALIVRRRLIEYFLERYNGELDPDDSTSSFPGQDPIFGGRSTKRKRRGKRKRTKSGIPTSIDILIPDPGTLDRYLYGFVSLFNFELITAITFFEMIPTWLRFLENQSLLEAEARHATLAQFSELHTALVQLGDQTSHYPNPKQALDRWGEESQTATQD